MRVRWAHSGNRAGKLSVVREKLLLMPEPCAITILVFRIMSQFSPVQGMTCRSTATDTARGALAKGVGEFEYPLL
jgi:hypothetical protein